MEPSLSLNHVFVNASFYERFALAADAGFSYVELGSWTDLDITRVNEELQEHQLRLTSLVGSHHDISRNETHSDFIEHLSQSIAVAKLFDCNNIIIETTIGSESTGSAADTSIIASADLRDTAIAIRILMAAAQRAERSGITLFLKPPPARPVFLPALRLAGNVIAAVNSSALRLLLDSTELWKCREQPEASRVMRRIHQFIGYVHIGDGSDKDKWQEELAWFGKYVVQFYTLNCYAGLLYPATADDTDFLQKFLSL